MFLMIYKIIKMILKYLFYIQYLYEHELLYYILIFI